jgi:NAD(P)-dependent dehydrogenase (short-subunit alcohol dehydrogenase family)
VSQKDSVLLKDEDSMLLKDKVTLVTGGGRGIGRSVAIAYAAQGAKVIIVARTEDELTKTERHVGEIGGSILAIPADISDDGQVARLRDRVLHEYGHLDVLVNNAAVMLLKTFDDMTPEDWDHTLNVNLRASFTITKAFWESIKSVGGGSIINVSTYSAVSGWKEEIHYCASKWGLDGFTRALAVEAYPYNIAVNALDTGRIKFKKTSWTDEYFGSLPVEYRARFADSSLITPAFVYLAMQKATGVTGRRLKADQLSHRIQVEGWGIRFEPVRFVRHDDAIGIDMDPAEI